MFWVLLYPIWRCLFSWCSSSSIEPAPSSDDLHIENSINNVDASIAQGIRINNFVSPMIVSSRRVDSTDDENMVISSMGVGPVVIGYVIIDPTVVSSTVVDPINISNVAIGPTVVDHMNYLDLEAVSEQNFEVLYNEVSTKQYLRQREIRIKKFFLIIIFISVFSFFIVGSLHYLSNIF